MVDVGVVCACACNSAVALSAAVSLCAPGTVVGLSLRCGMPGTSRLSCRTTTRYMGSPAPADSTSLPSTRQATHRPCLCSRSTRSPTAKSGGAAAAAAARDGVSDGAVAVLRRFSNFGEGAMLDPSESPAFSRLPGACSCPRVVPSLPNSAGTGVGVGPGPGPGPGLGLGLGLGSSSGSGPASGSSSGPGSGARCGSAAGRCFDARDRRPFALRSRSLDETAALRGTCGSSCHCL